MKTTTVSLLSIVLITIGARVSFAGGGTTGPGCPTRVADGLHCTSSSGNIEFVLVTQELQDKSCVATGKFYRVIDVGTSGEGGTLRGSAMTVYSEVLNKNEPIDKSSAFGFSSIATMQPQGRGIAFVTSTSGKIQLTYGAEAQAMGASGSVTESFSCTR